MSVSSILTSLNSQVSTTLGPTWSELSYIYELESNKFISGKNKYGVGTGTGNSVAGTNRAITLDFNFFVILTKTFVNRSSDSSERVALSSIMDEFETINQNIFQKKLNNANVLLVSNVDYDDPLVVDKSTISVRVNFVVKYRNQTT